MQAAIAKIQEKIFSKDNFNFEVLALELFHLQYTYNLVYKQFTDYLKINVSAIQSVQQIPFLPIELFKSHSVILDNVQATKIFESSGTSGQINSKHLVADLGLYEQSYTTCFRHFYGNIEDYTLLALLPSYLERENSSLVYMVNDLIKKTKQPDSGFYLHNYADLAKKISSLQTQKTGSKILLIGVTFALLDFAEQFPMDLSEVIIMETGGMKGRREEMTREDVHSKLKQAFNVENIHSEYGMTELLSQAYSKGNGIFKAPQWLKIYRRDIYNPLFCSSNTGRGGLNVIDLANVYSCSFIATQDVVNIISNDEFEITGRTDNSDIRGCNLMAV